MPLLICCLNVYPQKPNSSPSLLNLGPTILVYCSYTTGSFPLAVFILSVVLWFTVFMAVFQSLQLVFFTKFPCLSIHFDLLPIDFTIFILSNHYRCLNQHNLGRCQFVLSIFCPSVSHSVTLRNKSGILQGALQKNITYCICIGYI